MQTFWKSASYQKKYIIQSNVKYPNVSNDVKRTIQWLHMSYLTCHTITKTTVLMRSPLHCNEDTELLNRGGYTVYPGSIDYPLKCYNILHEVK